MWRLVGALVMYAYRSWTGRMLAAGGGALAVGEIAEVISLDDLRGKALQLAPGSDVNALEEAARTAARMLNLDGQSVLWGRHKDGTPITPKYMIVNLEKGEAWYTDTYYSKKFVNKVRSNAKPRYVKRGAHVTGGRR